MGYEIRDTGYAYHTSRIAYRFIIERSERSERSRLVGVVFKAQARKETG